MTILLWLLRSVVVQCIIYCIFAVNIVCYSQLFSFYSAAWNADAV